MPAGLLGLGGTIVTEPRLLEPIAGDFEYEVRSNVAIPLSWAKILKIVGERHYDYKCREAAKQGVVNALHNQALFNEDDEFRADHPEASMHPISWRNCDLMLKILEQARHVEEPEISDIRKWLQHTMRRIAARHEEIQGIHHEPRELES